MIEYTDEQHDSLIRGHRKQLADVQATVEALQAQLVTLKRHAGLDCGDQSCLYALEHSGMRTNGGCRCSPKRMKDDLERSRKAVEALQRERDFFETAAATANRMRVDTERALDAEREKVKGLHEITKVICAHCCEPMEIPSKAVLQTQLTQLQALVRALPVVRIDLNGAYHDTLLARPEDDAVKELLRYRATLDATTPAPMDAAETHDRMFKHMDRHPEAL